MNFSLSNPLLFLVGFFGASLSFAATKSSAMKLDISGAVIPGLGGYLDVEVGVPVYLQGRIFDGVFLQPGFLSRSAFGEGELTFTGPALMIGYQLLGRSGWNLAVSAGAGVDLFGDTGEGDLIPNIVLRIGHTAGGSARSARRAPVPGGQSPRPPRPPSPPSPPSPPRQVAASTAVVGKVLAPSSPNLPPPCTPPCVVSTVATVPAAAHAPGPDAFPAPSFAAPADAQVLAAPAAPAAPRPREGGPKINLAVSNPLSLLARIIHQGVEARPADRRERLAARPKHSEERSGSYATSEHRTYGQWF